MDNEPSAFKAKDRVDASGKRDIYFNSPRDGSRHGHVVERSSADGTVEYDYVRDVDGNVYVDRAKTPRNRDVPQRDRAR